MNTAGVDEEATAITSDVTSNDCTMSMNSQTTYPVAEVADTDYEDPNGPWTANVRASTSNLTIEEDSVAVAVVDGAGDDDGDGNDGDDENDATRATGRKMCNALTNKTMILFFILGVFSDIEVGYFSQPGFQKFVNLPDFNPVPGALCMMGGMITGALSATLLLIKLIPERRIMITAPVQFIGALFVWVLPKPFNLLVGSFVMMGGMVAQQIVLLPLTYYYGPSVTSSYVAGQTLAPLLGTFLINIFDWIHWDNNKVPYMIVLLSFPIITIIAFFALDRSALATSSNSNNEDDISQADAGADIDSDDGKNVEAKTNDTTSKSKQLTVSESMAAIQELMLRYLPWYVIQSIVFALWTTAIASPSLPSSTFSYAGSTVETIYVHTDRLALVMALISGIVIVLVIFSPLGKVVAHLSPNVMWINTGITVVVVVSGSLGVWFNAFPPMPVAAYSFLSIVFDLTSKVNIAFTEMILGSDTKLTQHYKEFQIQFLTTLFLVVQLAVTLLCMFWLQTYTLEACRKNYEDEYKGVTCTFFA